MITAEQARSLVAAYEAEKQVRLLLDGVFTRVIRNAAEQGENHVVFCLTGMFDSLEPIKAGLDKAGFSYCVNLRDNQLVISW